MRPQLACLFSTAIVQILRKLFVSLHSGLIFILCRDRWFLGLSKSEVSHFKKFERIFKISKNLNIFHESMYVKPLCTHYNRTKNLLIAKYKKKTLAILIFSKILCSSEWLSVTFLDCDYPTFRCISCELGSNKQVSSRAIVAIQEYQKLGKKCKALVVRSKL